MAHGFFQLVLASGLTVSLALGAAQAKALDVPPPEAAAIAEAIRARVATAIASDKSDVRIEFSGELRQADLPAAGESFRVAPEGLKIGRRQLLAPIEIQRDGKTIRSFWVPATAYVRALVVMPTHKIMTGATITATDVRLEKIEISDAGADLARRLEDVIGKIARRPLAADAPLELNSLAEPLLVRRGDMVNLSLKRGGIVVTATARAAEDGRLGETIRVKNLDFPSVVSARVTGHATVELH